ncbi:hypothetical protein ABEY54_28910 [Priestia megaterium]
MAKQNKDTIAYDLKSTEGKYIDNGSSITPKNDAVNVNVSIDHNLNERREDGSIMLKDFNQVSFELENKKEFTKYLFTTNPNSYFY